MALKKLKLSKRTVRNLDVRSGVRTGAKTFVDTMDCPADDPPKVDSGTPITQTCGTNRCLAGGGGGLLAGG